MRPWSSLMVVVLIVFCVRLPETKAARPGRPAFGRRTWVSVPSMRSATLRDGNPRSASSGLIAPIARADGEGPDLIDHAETSWGKSVRRWTRVTSSRLVNTNSYCDPAPAWRPPVAAAPLAAHLDRASHRGASR
jgi:hypothetical protein